MKALLPRLLFAALLAVTGSAAGDPVEMIEVADLRNEARIVRDRNLVLVLEFSSYTCPYCRKLEELFLLPMQRNRDYDDKVLIRSLPLSSFDTVVDFDGNQVGTEEFAARYDVSLTPTLLFLDSDGAEIGKRLVGLWSEDYFGGFIDERIDAARLRAGP